MENAELPVNIRNAFEKFDQEGENITLETLLGFLNARLAVATSDLANPAKKASNEQAYKMTKMFIPSALSPEEEIEKLIAAKDLNGNTGRTAALVWFNSGIQTTEGIMSLQQRMGIQYSRQHETRLAAMKAAVKFLQAKEV